MTIKLIVPFVLVTALSAQVATPNVNFEVASVKRSLVDPNSMPVAKCTGGPETSDPERFTCSNASIAKLVAIAYDSIWYRIKGKEWMFAAAECFNIEAKVPPGTSKPQMRVMLQHLIAERLGVVVHHESIKTPVYFLSVGKNGPLIKPLNDVPPGPGDIAAMGTSVVGAHWKLTGTVQPMKQFANYLQMRLTAEVIDDTHLTGMYDFNLDFMPPNMPSGIEDKTPEILDAMRNQFGLFVREESRPSDFVIIDHAEHMPTAN